MNAPHRRGRGVAGGMACRLLAVCLCLVGAGGVARARADQPEAAVTDADRLGAAPALVDVPTPAPGRLASLPSLPGWNEWSAGSLGSRSIDGILSAVLLFGVASVAPAILLMTTSFVRMSVVLSLVRQGLGTQGLPSNQIVTSLALFLSLLVMWPVWTAAYEEGVRPLQEGRIDASTALVRGSVPVRRWMAGQIERAGNRPTMLLFLSRHPSAPRDVRSYDDVPLETLLPAFLVSELETAFAIGVRFLVPFLVLDLLVAALLAATGLGAVSPASVGLPLKLTVFVMADGWSLVVGSLLDGMRTVG
jgi:flagellar biosynthetic protein FliP